MDIEYRTFDLIKKVKAAEVLPFKTNDNFIESANLDSFDIVNLIEQIENEFNISFGSEREDFDSLTNWSKFINIIKNKVMSR